MDIFNPVILDADLDEPAVSEAPLVTQGDSIELRVNVLKAGKPFPLAGVVTPTLAVQRKDGMVIIVEGRTEGENQVVFKMLKSTTAILGTSKFTVQLYDKDVERVSTLFGVYVVMEDISQRFEDLPEEELSLIQRVLGEGPSILVAAEQAVLYVKSVETRVEEHLVTYADLVERTDHLLGVIGTSVESANESAQAANTQAAYAKAQGDYAKREADRIVGIDGAGLQAELDAHILNKEAHIPKGLISMWSGAINALPQGWALCDGTNGTPNLRDRFIVGAGSTYAVGDTGGASTHNLNHDHAVSINTDSKGAHTHPVAGTASSAGAHTHPIDATTSSNGSHSHTQGNTGGPSLTASIRSDIAQTSVATSQHVHTNPTTSAQANHNHGVTATSGSSGAHTHPVSGTASSGGDHAHSVNGKTAGALATVDNKPPYFALAFIMKL